MLKFLVLHFTNTNTKGGKSVNSDHVPLEMDLDFKLIPKNQQELSYIRKGKYRLATPAVSCSGDPPLDSETGWTGELWSNCVLLLLLCHAQGTHP